MYQRTKPDKPEKPVLAVTPAQCPRRTAGRWETAVWFPYTWSRTAGSRTCPPCPRPSACEPPQLLQRSSQIQPSQWEGRRRWRPLAARSSRDWWRLLCQRPLQVGAGMTCVWCFGYRGAPVVVSWTPAGFECDSCSRHLWCPMAWMNLEKNNRRLGSGLRSLGRGNLFKYLRVPQQLVTTKHWPTDTATSAPCQVLRVPQQWTEAVRGTNWFVQGILRRHTKKDDGKGEWYLPTPSTYTSLFHSPLAHVRISASFPFPLSVTGYINLVSAHVDKCKQEAFRVTTCTIELQGRISWKQSGSKLEPTEQSSIAWAAFLFLLRLRFQKKLGTESPWVSNG